MELQLQFLKIFGISFVVFTLLDFVWLAGIAYRFYSNSLGDLARRSAGVLSPEWPAAMVAYICLVLGLVLYVVIPQISEPMIHKIFISSALYGFIIYAVYGFTNYAIIARWPMNLVVADVAWGTVLYGLSGVIVIKIIQYVGI